MGSITGLYQCPGCSKPISYRSSEANTLVCSCGTVVSRLKSGAMSSLAVAVVAFPEDYIQTGTSGKRNGVRFEVIGRCRLWLDEAVYNYWTVIFDNGSICYLAEGYGLYAFHTPLEQRVTASNFSIKNAGTGSELNLLGEGDYLYHGKDTVVKIEVEGECIIPGQPRDVRIYNFSSYTGLHLQFLEWAPDALTAYRVEYIKPGDLELANTNDAALRGKEFKCPVCKISIQVKTFPYAQSCSCTNCGNHFSLHNSIDFKKSGKDKFDDNALSIPLGAKGNIQGIMYEVIGYAKKEEANEYQSQWKEYILYNKIEGYAFLSEYNGHWIYLREQGDAPVVKRLNVDEIEYRLEPFKRFNTYTYKTVDTAGEFPYDIFNDGKTEVWEFISPPEMWSVEINKREGVTWFYGRYVSERKMREQFPYTLPYPSGVGVLQPGFINPLRILKAGVLAVIFMLIVHMIIGSFLQNKVLLDASYTLIDSLNTTSFVTDKFELTKRKSNLEFQIIAPVNNSWFELQANLVNAKTGEEFTVEQGVEYYTGYDGGESWSEGSTNETVYLSSIPAGTYFLQLSGTKEMFSLVNSFQIKVTYDTAMSRNFYIFLVLLLLWPVIKCIQIINKEKRRWYNSPFSAS
ncbi:DUF4178 domain-containing protein [Foetidibacter luteolus]|uniref:DUF4178 domain-containing protein n=1 Tax=Foetidibacter luteolus TaxID=2608880 RepID=UPI00129B3BA6|nr:DUF4178 domain-containing protein [Foetidibacter luteolus]